MDSASPTNPSVPIAIDRLGLRSVGRPLLFTAILFSSGMLLVGFHRSNRFYRRLN